MADIFTYCYLSNYTNWVRDTSTDFHVRVLSHLLTFSLALKFEIPGLVALVEHRFQEAFTWYVENMDKDKVVEAFRLCISEDFVRESGLVGATLALLHDTALTVFRGVVEQYKGKEEWTEMVQLMESVPWAVVEMYRRSIVGEEGDWDGKDEA
jgi:hypothetical protein